MAPPVDPTRPDGLASTMPRTCDRTLAQAFAILPRARGSASSSIRRTVVSDGAAPSTGSMLDGTLRIVAHLWASGRGLEHLARGLAPFVDAAMTAATPAGRDWLEVLAARDRSRFGPDRRYSLNDPRFLLRVVAEEQRAFRERLSRVEQGFASELRDAGNKWAHGDDFTSDDTHRALDTIERLLCRPRRSARASAACAGALTALGSPSRKPSARGMW